MNFNTGTPSCRKYYHRKGRKNSAEACMPFYASFLFGMYNDVFQLTVERWLWMTLVDASGFGLTAPEFIPWQTEENNENLSQAKRYPGLHSTHSRRYTGPRIPFSCCDWTTDPFYATPGKTRGHVHNRFSFNSDSTSQFSIFLRFRHYKKTADETDAKVHAMKAPRH
jgi:hypothetical protein